MKLDPSQELLLNEGKLLPLMEEFYSLQGEGYNTGKPAYFIRVGGCDMGCAWCDVKESWNASLHPLTLTSEIVERAATAPAKAVVVTGGEPVLYNLDFLCKGLKNHGVLTYLETAGVRPLTGTWDWICLSPKKGRLPLAQYFETADELKVIICNEGDFKWAERNAKRCHPECKLFLQPEWSVAGKIMPVIVNYIKEHPKWRMSLQSHKYMNIP